MVLVFCPERIKVDLEELPPIYDVWTAMRDDAPAIHSPGNVLTVSKVIKGYTEAALNQAEVSSYYLTFADYFVRYEPRHDGKTHITSTVAIPLTSLSEIYAKLESILGRTITGEVKTNALEFYRRILYGYTNTQDEDVQDQISGISSGLVIFPLSEATI